MHRSRSLLYVRNGACAIAVLLLSVLFLPFVPLLLLPVRFAWPVARTYLRCVLFLLKSICGVTIAVHGREHLNRDPVLIASCSLTWLETLIFAVLLDNPAMVVDADALRYPLVGWLARRNGYLAVGEAIRPDRNGSAARRAVESGRAILVDAGTGHTGEEGGAMRRRAAAVLYESLRVACTPLLVDAGQVRAASPLLAQGTILIDILSPIAPGLAEEAFIDRLDRSLAAAAARMVARHDMPVLMPTLSEDALKWSAALQRGHEAETG